jgi:hypothetical protein
MSEATGALERMTDMDLEEGGMGFHIEEDE